METNARIVITDEHTQIILGSLLGDGGLEPPPKGSVNWGLSFKHGLAQQEYALRKAHLLGALVRKVDYPDERIRVRTARHPFLSQWASEVIVEGRRSIPPRLLSEISPLGLAVWYMDDGSLQTTANKNGTFWRLVRIATCCFTIPEVDALCTMLKERFDVLGLRKMSKNPRDAQHPYPNIHINGVDAEKFLQIVRPHMVNMGMDYKKGSSDMGME